MIVALRQAKCWKIQVNDVVAVCTHHFMESMESRKKKKKHFWRSTVHHHPILVQTLLWLFHSSKERKYLGERHGRNNISVCIKCQSFNRRADSQTSLMHKIDIEFYAEIFDEYFKILETNWHLSSLLWWWAEKIHFGAQRGTPYKYLVVWHDRNNMHVCTTFKVFIFDILGYIVISKVGQTASPFIVEARKNTLLSPNVGHHPILV